MAVTTERAGRAKASARRLPRVLPPPSQTDAATATAIAERSNGAQLSVREPTGGDLLLADLRVAFELVNHARYQALARILGVPREQANLATAVIALMVGEAVQGKFRTLVAAPAVPEPTDVLLGAATLRELLSEVTGLPPEDTPVLGTVLVAAALAAIARPALNKSARAASKLPHAARKVSHRMNAAFRRRYGYIVDPGHLRSYRAQRRAAARVTSSI